MTETPMRLRLGLWAFKVTADDAGSTTARWLEKSMGIMGGETSGWRIYSVAVGIVSKNTGEPKG